MARGSPGRPLCRRVARCMQTAQDGPALNAFIQFAQFASKPASRDKVKDHERNDVSLWMMHRALMHAIVESGTSASLTST